MPNPNIGSITCPMCGELVAVRRASRGARSFYIYCAHDGMITPNLPGGQAYIQHNATFYEERQAESPAPAEPVTEKSAERPRNDDRGGWLL